MSDGDTIAQVAVVVLLLVLAVPALATAHEFAGTPLDYSETLTVDYTAESAVVENATVEGYSDTVTITSGGQTLAAGTDYRWNADDGTVNWLDTANTTSGDSATIEYQAYQRTGESALAWTVISPLMGLFGLFALISSVRAVWELTAEVWDL
jgi:hypothetical protein